MTEIVCGSCGARAAIEAACCPACGQDLSPSGRPTGAWVPRSSRPRAARPIGLALLAATEVVVALVGILVIIDLAFWSNYDLAYDNPGWGIVDGAFCLAYVAATLTGFTVAWKLWSLEPEAWRTAVLLSVGLLALDVASIFLWGLTNLDLVGIVAHGCVLTYLNRAHVRALFGRPTTTLFAART